MARERSHTRRRFFITTGAALQSGLAGCIGGDTVDTGDGGESSDGRGTTTGSEVPGNAQVRNNLQLTYPEYELEDSLSVLHWNEYWHDTAVEDFEEAFDVDVSVETHSSLNEFIRDMTQSEFNQYDVVFPSDWLIRGLIDTGWIMPLDMGKLPKFDNLADRWIENVPYDSEDQRHSAPYQWGTTGIGWNNQMVDGSLDDIETLDSWDAFWDEQFAGQIQMLDEGRELYAVALKRLGESLNTTDQSIIEEATQILIEQKQTMELSSEEYSSAALADVLLDQEATPLHTWSGEAFVARYSAEDATLRYTIPQEGSVVWIDAGVIPSGASNPNAAHTMINYTMAKSVAAQITNRTFYASPNEAARSEILDEILTDPAIYPPPEVEENLEFIRNIGDASEHYQRGLETIREA